MSHIHVLVTMSYFSVKDTELWMRLSAGIHFGGSAALNKIWRNGRHTGLPTNQRRIYQSLDQARNARGRRIAETTSLSYFHLMG